MATFPNPILPGMHPDPSICRVGRDFYLACSSFEYFPGVPILHSRDLVRWRPVGHALTRKSQLDLAGVQSSRGVYAPTLRHHERTFYLVTTLVDRGHFVVTAKRASGPWSEPVWLDEDGIDPSLAFLDGRIYYTRNGRGSDPDHPFVYQGELDQELHLRKQLRVIWKGTGGIWPEAPHLFRRGRFYYLLTGEGGTSYGHSVVVARSRRPYGPFEPSPHGPLLTHRERPRDPIQATGHADWVELDDGTTWAVLLAIRVTGGRHHHLGRETFLAPVGWGWQQHLEVAVQARLDFEPTGDGEEAGLCVRANEGFHYALLVGTDERGGRVLRLTETIADRSRTVAASRLGRGRVRLRIEATAREYAFLVGAGGEIQELGRLPARALSAETIQRRTGAHHFTGAMFGLLATGNGRRATAPADFDWFDYLPGA